MKMKNKIQVQLTKRMKINRDDALSAINYLKTNYPKLGERCIELLTEEVLDMLINEYVYKELVDDYMNYNKDRSKGMNDVRNPEQVKLNHFIGIAWECIMNVILEYKGFKVFRNGCDEDILNTKYSVISKPDFEVLDTNNNVMLVDIQKGKYILDDEVRVKESKIKGLLKYDNIIMTWCDWNGERIIYNSKGFKSLNEVKAKMYKFNPNGICMGKGTYHFRVNPDEIRVF